MLHRSAVDGSSTIQCNGVEALWETCREDNLSDRVACIRSIIVCCHNKRILNRKRCDKHHMLYGWGEYNVLCDEEHGTRGESKSDPIVLRERGVSESISMLIKQL